MENGQHMENGVVSFGKESLGFRVLYGKRKNLEIAVHPDGSIVVKAPPSTDGGEIRKRVLKHARWIVRQRDYFRQFEPRTPPRQYVGGETHLYLGRQYRLKIMSGEPEGVKLSQGFFLVSVRGEIARDRVRELLLRWYAQKAAVQYRESLERCWSHFRRAGAEKPCLRIRSLEKRWGSLSAAGILSLNRDLVRAPRECIDYVVTHELCHMQYRDHGPSFYSLLEKTMPDWKTRKHRLEIALS